MAMKRLHVLIGPDAYKQARALADNRGQTLSEWVRALIADALEKEKKA